MFIYVLFSKSLVSGLWSLNTLSLLCSLSLVSYFWSGLCLYSHDPGLYPCPVKPVTIHCLSSLTLVTVFIVGHSFVEGHCFLLLYRVFLSCDLDLMSLYQYRFLS